MYAIAENKKIKKKKEKRMGFIMGDILSVGLGLKPTIGLSAISFNKMGLMTFLFQVDSLKTSPIVSVAQTRATTFVLIQSGPNGPA